MNKCVFLVILTGMLALNLPAQSSLRPIVPQPVYAADTSFVELYYKAWEASKVYEFLGIRGLQTNVWPEAEHPLQEGNVAYHLRTGKHDITEYDWNNYIQFANKYFKK
ncbi:MAG: hypothetical protein J6X69_04760 [Bacteroidales bacterium]|nr:hypothetical protein [Bacteroidales bacterium]